MELVGVSSEICLVGGNLKWWQDINHSYENLQFSMLMAGRGDQSRVLYLACQDAELEESDLLELPSPVRCRIRRFSKG